MIATLSFRVPSLWKGIMNLDSQGGDGMAPGQLLLPISLIQRRIIQLAGQLGESGYAIGSRSSEDGSAHIEASDAYYLVVRERGVELERLRTLDVDELLYWICERLTSSIAGRAELRHRRQGEDPRRQAFARQIDLLSRLSRQWAARRAMEQARILVEHPFHDA